MRAMKSIYMIGQEGPATEHYTEDDIHPVRRIDGKYGHLPLVLSSKGLEVIRICKTCTMISLKESEERFQRGWFKAVMIELDRSSRALNATNLLRLINEHNQNTLGQGNLYLYTKPLNKAGLILKEKNPRRLQEFLHSLTDQGKEFAVQLWEAE